MIQIETTSKMQIPEPYSDRPILLWATLGVDFQLNKNILWENPTTQQMVAARFRVINCQVDLTDINGTAIQYIDENGNTATYYANYNGWHPIIGWGLVSVASGVDSTTLQVGI